MVSHRSVWVRLLYSVLTKVNIKAVRWNDARLTQFFSQKGSQSSASCAYIYYISIRS